MIIVNSMGECVPLTIMGWIVSSPNSYVEALTPSTSECNVI